MGPGESLAANGGDLDQVGGDESDARDDLHVAELAHIVVPSVQRAPADEDVGGALQGPFPPDHPLAMVFMAAWPGVRLVHRGSRLLDLEEQRVVAAAALEQHQIDPHADTADADDLADHIDQREPVEQTPEVLLQGQAIPGEELVDEVGLLFVIDGDANRRILVDPRPAVDHAGELAEGALARADLRLLLDVGRQGAAVRRFEVLDQVIDGDAVVPDVQLGRIGISPHALAVGRRRRHHRGLGDARLVPGGAGRHHQARRQTLEIPLEGAGQGFVEVAQVEQQVPLGRRPESEIEDVGIAAELHLEAAVRFRRQVGGHHRGRPPVIVPRRHRHAPVPEGHQIGRANLVLAGDRGERVVAACLLVPVPLGAGRHPLAGGLPRRFPLLDGRGEIVEPGRRKICYRSFGSRHGVPLMGWAISAVFSRPVTAPGRQRRIGKMERWPEFRVSAPAGQAAPTPSDRRNWRVIRRTAGACGARRARRRPSGRERTGCASLTSSSVIGW